MHPPVMTISIPIRYGISNPPCAVPHKKEHVFPFCFSFMDFIRISNSINFLSFDNQINRLHYGRLDGSFPPSSLLTIYPHQLVCFSSLFSITFTNLLG